MSNRPPCPKLEKEVKHLEKQLAPFDTIDHALEDCKDAFQALLNATPDSAMLMDTKGTILAINEAGAQRLCKEADEVIGENVYGLLPPRYRQGQENKGGHSPSFRKASSFSG